MNFITSGILSRVDDALFSLLLMLVIQAAVMAVGVFIRKSFNPAPYAAVLMRPLAVFLCDKLNRDGRSDFALVVRGSLVFFVILAVISFVGIGLEQLFVTTGLGAYMDVFMLALLISPISVLVPAYAVSRPNARKGSYRYISQALNQNLIPSDDFGLRRAAVRAMSLSLNDWVIAPILFYLLGGMPLVCLYVSLSLFIRVTARNTPVFLSIYAYAYNVLEKLAAIICLVTVFSSSVFSAGGRPFQVLQAVGKDGLNVESFFAYAQNVTLGGSIQNRQGEKIQQGWVGPEGTTAKITRKDVIRIAIQYAISVFLVFVMLFAMYVFL